jgi:tetraacyldisaccharide 4'-kinase
MMFDPSEFREIVSGRRRGVGATALRGLLRAGEFPYALAVRWRNRRFDAGSLAIHRVGVPVISIGNLTLGGTGKTPMVKWLAQWLMQRNIRVAIVSRGYGARAGCENDEALELRHSLPGVPHVQNPDRVAAARRAIDHFHCQSILLDDGFQHRRLARDLDIVLLDALEPFGFDHVFPRGTLRESVVGLRRAQVIGLSRADVVPSHQRESIRRRVAHLAPHAAWCELAHKPSGLLNVNGSRQPLDAVAGRRVAAFCGIGNPAGFRQTLSDAGCNIVAWRPFPDHHAYTDADCRALSALASESRADALVCTHKDWVKLREASFASLPLWAITLELQFLSGQDSLLAAVDRSVSNGSPIEKACGG